MTSSTLPNADFLIKFPLLNPYNKVTMKSIVVQLTYNEISRDKNLLLPVIKTIMSFTGQKPKILKSKNSIASFKIRKNMEVGALVTIRHQNMLNFLKIILLNLPKFTLNNFSISLKIFDFFFLNNPRIGANITINFSTLNSSFAPQSLRNFYLSSLLIH